MSPVILQRCPDDLHGPGQCLVGAPLVCVNDTIGLSAPASPPPRCARDWGFSETRPNMGVRGPNRCEQVPPRANAGVVWSHCHGATKGILPWHSLAILKVRVSQELWGFAGSANFENIGLRQCFSGTKPPAKARNSTKMRPECVSGMCVCCPEWVPGVGARRWGAERVPRPADDTSGPCFAGQAFLESSGRWNSFQFPGISGAVEFQEL